MLPPSRLKAQRSTSRSGAVPVGRPRRPSAVTEWAVILAQARKLPCPA
ncbi:hypothetical protein ACFFX0_30935 [Citricoccus parietis]|uniref:Uncharacterized protein n=1 Tax=Citricoccus parietis TaxID=592307 RepID=A0ABV5G8U1_9MICC